MITQLEYQHFQFGKGAADSVHRQSAGYSSGASDGYSQCKTDRGGRVG